MFWRRCSGGPKSTDFWPTIKPFLSSKAAKNSADIILMENDCLVSDQKEVFNILNDFYINIAQEIGIHNQSSDPAGTHPSIQATKENSPNEGYENFYFKPISEGQVLKNINSLSSKKATSVDQIQPKFLRQEQKFYLAPFLVYLTKTFLRNSFLTGLK